MNGVLKIVRAGRSIEYSETSSAAVACMSVIALSTVKPPNRIISTELGASIEHGCNTPAESFSPDLFPSSLNIGGTDFIGSITPGPTIATSRGMDISRLVTELDSARKYDGCLLLFDSYLFAAVICTNKSRYLFDCYSRTESGLAINEDDSDSSDNCGEACLIRIDDGQQFIHHVINVFCSEGDGRNVSFVFTKFQHGLDSAAKKRKMISMFQPVLPKKSKKDKNDAYYHNNQSQRQTYQLGYYSQNQAQRQTYQLGYYSQNQAQRQTYQLGYNSQNQPQRQTYLQGYYMQNQGQKQAYQSNYRASAAQRLDEDKVIRKFQSMVESGPDYICCECERALYKRANNVILLSNANLSVDKTILGGQVSFDGKVYVCRTCLKYLKCEELPPISVRNTLKVEVVPEELQLTPVESYLVAQRKLFAKIIRMPKGQQQKLKGSVVNVPVAAENVASVLTPFVDKALLIMLKYKRKLEYNSDVGHELIRPENIIRAIRILCDINHFYSHLSTEDFRENLKLATAEAFSDQQPTIEDEQQSTSTEHTFQSASTRTSTLGSTNEDPRIAFANQNVVTCTQPFNPLDSISHSFDESTNVFCIAPGEGKTPLSLTRDKNVEYLAYPTLFPTGKFGFNSARVTPLSSSQYFSARLLHYSGRFSSNEDYVFFAQSIIEQDRLMSSIQIALKKTSFNLSVSQALDKNLLDRLTTNDKAYKFMSKLPGTPAYWNVFLYDLLAMIRQLGVPQFWHTVSCADLEWPELYRVLSRKLCTSELTDEQISQLTYEEKCGLLNKDPVTVARHFQYRLECYMNEVLKSPLNLLGGKISYYAIKIEFQLRGSPHAHMLLWVTPHVVLSAETIADYCSYIEDIVSANLPTDDDDLRILIEKYQIHRHTKSCRKKGSMCRFHFPKFPTDKTVIAVPIPSDTPTDERTALLEWRDRILKKVLQVITSLDSLNLILVELLQLCEIEEDDYYKALSTASDIFFEIYLKRSVESINVNSFSRVLLKAYRANIDLSPVLDPYGCIMYLASYMAKNETTASSAMCETAKRARELNLTSKETMEAISISFVNSREVSKQESVYRCLPMLYLRKIFPGTLFVDTNLKDDRVRMLRSRAELEELEPDSSDIYCSGIHAKYADRPTVQFKLGKFAAVDKICLADFASMYYRFYGKTGVYEYLTDYQPSTLDEYDEDHNEEEDVADDEDDLNSRALLPDKFPLMSSKVVYTLRRVPGVIRFHKFNFEKEPEKFYHHVLLLYLPWRCETELIGPSGTYYSKFADEEVSGIVERNRQLYESTSSELERALAYQCQLNAFSDSVYDSVAPQSRQEDADVRNENIESDSDDDCPDPALNSISRNYKLIATTEILSSTTVEVFRSMIRTLNSDQRRVFQHMISWFRSNRKADVTVQPPLIFLHGGGGVGKSFLIRSIAAAATRFLPQPGGDFLCNLVGLFALTGVASFNLDGGLVIDSALSMNRNHRGCLPAVGAAKLAQLRSIWMNLKLVVIDEISMMSPERLCHLHQRICEIKGLDFASTQVKLFAGVSVILVGDLFQLPPVLAQPIFSTPSNPFMAVKDVWREFRYVELLQLMRQEHGSQFGNVLSRIRKGRQTDDDIKYLQQASLTIDRSDQNYPKHVLHLFAEVATANNYNTFMLSSMETDEVLSLAVDIIPESMPKQRSDAIVTSGRRNTGGLETSLRLKEGAQIMLTRNVDVTDGLVNGAIGKIVSFKVVGSRIDTVFVKFDNSEIGEKTRRMSPSFIANANNAVPIKRITTPIGNSCGTANKIRRTQFPLVLAWATTIHKAQGLTLDKVVIDFKTTKNWKFQPGQAYVALSRVKTFDGLHLLNFDPSQIRVNRKALVEVEKLESENKLSFAELKSDCEIQILSLNIQGIATSAIDLFQDPLFQSSDVILLQETQMTQPSSGLFEPIGFECVAQVLPFKFASKMMYCKKPHKVTLLHSDNISQILSVAFGSYKVVMASVYKPQSASSSELLSSLQIAVETWCTTVIAGDFNFAPSDKAYDSVTQFLHRHAFVNLITWPTHLAGRTIDHFYTKGIPNEKCACYAVYYSDHDAAVYRFVPPTS